MFGKSVASPIEEKILSYLPGLDVETSRSVSKTWNARCSSEPVWRQIFARVPEGLSAYLPRSLKNYRSRWFMAIERTGTGIELKELVIEIENYKSTRQKVCFRVFNDSQFKQVTKLTSCFAILYVGLRALGLQYSLRIYSMAFCAGAFLLKRCFFKSNALHPDVFWNYKAQLSQLLKAAKVDGNVKLANNLGCNNHS